MSMSGQAIFNVAVFVLGALSELWPWFKNWWDGLGKWRDPVLLGVCLLVAGIFLGACALDVPVENCVPPVGLDDAWVAILAALAAYGLFHAARMFVQGGLFAARRVKAALL